MESEVAEEHPWNGLKQIYIIILCMQIHALLVQLHPLLIVKPRTSHLAMSTE
jgi:hypothetical protein